MATIGHFSLFLALLAAGWGSLASLLGILQGGRGLKRSGERSLLAVAGFVLVAVLCLEYAFLTDDFRLDTVYHYSSSSQKLPYKIAALWGGQAGSLLLWVAILAGMGVVCVWTNQGKNRLLMPWVVAVLAAVELFFLVLLNFIESPFTVGPPRPDGVGLNPQLKNFWMMIHPPCLYLGYVAFTIPFAFAIAALAMRRTGDVWFRTTRRWTLFAWFFLGTGILMGAYWAYIELGWGGYWAWDPVENASLMPWLVGTAFLHSVMVQEKKGMLKVWNVVLILLTFCLVIFGTFLTRSGIISSVHAFATSGIGPAFGVFLGLVFFGSVALVILRLEDLRSKAHLESVLSRESAFLFNNLILVGMAITILFLTTFPILSEAVTGRKVTMGPPIFNLVNIPWALVLLLLTGVGPLIAWRRATSSNLKRSFTVPALVGAWVLLALAILEGRAFLRAAAKAGTAIARLDIASFLEQLKVYYPALTFSLGAFVFATVFQEFSRGARARMRQHGESLLVALVRLVLKNKRRYGGYIVHAGIVIVFVGIAGSAAYQKEHVEMLEPGGVLRADDYTLRYDGVRLEAVDDHLAAVTELLVFYRGELLGRLEAEQRFHLNLVHPALRQAFYDLKERDDRGSAAYRAAVADLYRLLDSLERTARRELKTPSTEVGIHRSLSPLAPSRLGEDLYVIPLGVDPFTGQANFRVFVNPMVNLIWLGGLVFFVGTHLAVLPDRRERRRLEAAIALEERAVAAA